MNVIPYQRIAQTNFLVVGFLVERHLSFFGMSVLLIGKVTPSSRSHRSSTRNFFAAQIRQTPQVAALFCCDCAKPGDGEIAAVANLMTKFGQTER
jgi:hypothetical protein